MSELITTTEKYEERIQHCENCNSVLNGPFCGQCGQSVESVLKYFGAVVLHLLDDIFSFDSRATRTLSPLLFKPGFLTNEYIAGKRVFYVPPLRLYLFISIIFFLCLNLITSNVDNLVNYQSTQVLQSKISDEINRLEAIKIEEKIPLTEEENLRLDRFKKHSVQLSDDTNFKLQALTTQLIKLEFKKLHSETKLSAKDQHNYDALSSQIEEVIIENEKQVKTLAENTEEKTSADIHLSFLSDEQNKLLGEEAIKLEKKAKQAFQSDARPLIKQVFSVLPQLMFVLLPIFALLLKIIFIFSNRLYMEHLTVALHSHSFLFIMLLLIMGIDGIPLVLFKESQLFKGLTDLLSFALLVWTPVYLFLMQRRVYQQGKLMTFTKFVFIGILYFMLLGATAFIAFIWGLTNL